MNEEGIFNAKYEKALELAEMISPSLVKSIYNLIGKMPSSLKRYISMEKSCELTGVDKTIELNMEGSLMELQRTDLKTNLRTFIYIYPFYASELRELPEDSEDDDHTMLLASITYTNTDDDVENIITHYIQKDDKYEFQKYEIPNGAFEFDFSIYIDIINGKYYLNYVSTINDMEYKTKKIEIPHNELLEYACDQFENCEEDYGEDYEGFIDSFGCDE